VLSLNHTEFEIYTPDAFSPSALGLLRPPYYPLGGRGNFSCVQNPTKTELNKGIYKPRLTLTKRKGHAGFTLTLRIEFSAPKLLFGNNFDELLEEDFERLLDILQGKLASMGVRIRKDILRNAAVSAVHYSKNIPLTDYSTCSMIMSELAKVDLNTRLDLNKTDYRNEGHSVRYHANSYEIIFYDKLKDMEQAAISEKRAIERDSVIQRDLFKQSKYPKQFQVLRMEIRLGNRTKLKTLLAQLGIKAGLTFQEIFSATISKGIQLYFWQAATQDTPLLALSQFRPEDVIQAMIAEGKGNTKPAKLLQRLGALMLMRSIGIRGIKAILKGQCNSRTWQRIRKELDGMDITGRMKYAAVGNVQRCLEVFEPLRMRDYSDKESMKVRV